MIWIFISVLTVWKFMTCTLYVYTHRVKYFKMKCNETVFIAVFDIFICQMYLLINHWTWRVEQSRVKMSLTINYKKTFSTNFLLCLVWICTYLELKNFFSILEYGGMPFDPNTERIALRKFKTFMYINHFFYNANIAVCSESIHWQLVIHSLMN